MTSANQSSNLRAISSYAYKPRATSAAPSMSRLTGVNYTNVTLVAELFGLYPPGAFTHET